MNEDFIFETDEEGCGIVLEIPAVDKAEGKVLLALLQKAMVNYDGVELLQKETGEKVQFSLKGDLSDVLALAEELRPHFTM